MRERPVKIFRSLLLIAWMPVGSYSQDSIAVDRWEFLPGHGRPFSLLANPVEPRLGLAKRTGTSRMQLDVGASLDLIGYTPSPGYQFLFGAALFSYALATNSQGLNLQIDAVDGFYGGYLCLERRFENFTLLVRFRFVHHSAHFVDGHVDPATHWWKENRAPVPFTRDFGEVVIGMDWKCSGSVLRVYSGFSYSIKVRPSDLRRFESLHGLEWHTTDGLLKGFGKPVNFYVAYNLGVAGSSVYIGTSRVEAGGKLGHWAESGIRLFVGYHNGLDVFGQYYDVRRMFWQIGFALDL